MDEIKHTALITNTDSTEFYEKVRKVINTQQERAGYWVDVQYSTSMCYRNEANGSLTQLTQYSAYIITRGKKSVNLEHPWMQEPLLSPNGVHHVI